MKKQSLTKLSFATLLFFAGVFSACGDGSTSSNNTDENKGSFSEVKDISDLGRCTDERDGDTVYVVEKMRDYVCVNHAWVDISELDDSGLSSGDVRSSSSVSGSEASSSSFNENAYTDENLVVKKRSILGVAQKGPFKFGSPVYLRELAGDSLHYSGKVYEDEISSNKGDFVIPNVNLIYPYVSVEVNGQYRNEITGTYSQKPLSLFALSDLVTDSRTKINVNLLTHLEYGRAMYLVRKGYSVYAAKKQADQELMTAFELPTTIKYSEDLSVFEDSEDDNVDYANASLMMLNLLFLGNRSDDEIIALIDNFTTDFEKDGVWDDESTKAAMADFAKEVDGAEIRANVKAWNILDIPNFEEQMEMFWNNVYGLGGCTSVRSGVITKNQNKYSKNFEAYYKCDAGSWVKATQLEYDTYGWGTGTVGEVKKGDVTDAKYVYRDGKWNQASVAEGGLGSCLAKNEGTILTYGPSYGLDYYVCKSRQWTKLTVAEADVYGWSAGTVGEVKKGTYTEAKYVYRNGKWNAASSVETALGSCTTSYTGTVKVNESTYYICKSSAWSTATVLEYDTYGWSAGAAGEVKKGDVTDVKYVYRNGAWSAASAVEASLGSCLAKDEGSIQTYNSDYYACESSKWTKITATQADIYGWSAGEVGEVKKGTYTDTKYVYRNGKWSTASSVETTLGSCTTSDVGTVRANESTYYICRSNAWTTATVLEYDTYGWSAGAAGEVKKGDVTDTKYIYRNDAWSAASELEANLGSCIAKDEGSIQTYNSDYYACESTKWVKITPTQADIYGWSAGEVGEVKKGTYTDTKYVYRDGKWSVASEQEISLGSCVSENANTVILKTDSYYACENSQWKKLSEFEADTYSWFAGEVGEVRKGTYTEAKYVYRNEKWNIASVTESILGSCVSSNAGVVKNYESVFYICKSNEWTTATVLDYDTYGWTAGEVGEVKKGNYTDAYYICKSNTWMEASMLEYDTYGLNCFEDGAIIDGAVNRGNKYVCDAGTFRAASENEIELNLGCTNYNQNQSIFFEDEWESVTWICLEKWIDKRTYKYRSLTDDRDGQIYKTVKIGSQIWMAENLNYRYTQKTSLIDSSSFCFNEPDSCDKFNRLYLWSAAMDSAGLFSTAGKRCGYNKTCSANGFVRGVCPEGWHLPSNNEWKILFTAVGGASNAGEMLKSSSDWLSTNGIDSYGFSALPAGYYSILYYNSSFSNRFYDVGSYAYFWSSTEYDSNYAYYMYLSDSHGHAYLNSYVKNTARSVRCLKDDN